MHKAAKAVIKRLSFELTYKRSRARRDMEPGVISGEDTDHAWGEGGSPGGWNNYDFARWPEDEDDHQQWVRHFFTLAMQEAIHEGLEWFQLDGRPLLNPHDRVHSDLDWEVLEASNEFIDKLWALAKSRREAEEELELQEFRKAHGTQPATIFKGYTS